MNEFWDVIPDIHGDMNRLEATLAALGNEANIAFLGDFIDALDRERPAQDAAVLTCVRQLIESGAAIAVMGNHELNAILYHTVGADGAPLRAHSEKNKAQHASFVRRFGTSTPEALEWVNWFLTLPLWLDLGGLRLVHACWSQPDIDLIAERRPDGRLHVADLPEIAVETTDFGRAVKNLVSGPELHLPANYSFRDYRGHERREVRIAWWRADVPTWRDASLSVPNPHELPEGEVPRSREVVFYEAQNPPVFVGHYKMTGSPCIEAPQAACLDYPDAPCAYRWRGEKELTKDGLVLAPVSIDA